MTCVNCNTETTGNFCPNCGQRAHVKRISLKESWLDFWSRVYGFDGMFPRTLIDLTIRPGVAAKRFIAGNRVMYYGPVGYFFLMITVCLLIFSMIGVDYFDFMKGMQKAMTLNDPSIRTSEKISDYVQRLVADNLKTFVFLIIPFQAFCARFLFFRKSGYNFLENTVLPFYMQGHIFWITIISGAVYKWTGYTALFPVFILSLIYQGVGYATLMTYQSKVKAFFKGVFLYFAAQLLFTMVMLIFLVLGILWLYYFDNETFQLLRPSNNR